MHLSTTVTSCIAAGLVLLVSSGGGLAKSSVVFSAPFKGFSSTHANSTGSSGCGATSNIVTLPSFNTTSGRIRMAFNASAPPRYAFNCTSKVANSASAEESVSIKSATFKVSGNGAYTVRANIALHLHMDLVLVTNSTNSSRDASASGIVYASMEVFDKTSLGFWTSSGAMYSNTTTVRDPGHNVSDHVALNHVISVPMIVPLTKGDVYYVEVYFSTSVKVTCTHFATLAFADLALGNSAGTTALESVTAS